MALMTQKAAFIHVPKTGGSWCRAVIASCYQCHESGPFEDHDHAGLSDLLPESLGQRFSFGFVRHPVTWLQSRWAWAMETGFPQKIRDPQHPEHATASRHWMAEVWSDEFEGFATAYCDRGIPEGGRTFESKLACVGFIGRYESLRNDLLIAMELAGQPLPLSALATTPPYKAAGSTKYSQQVLIPGRLVSRLESLESAILARFYPRG